MVGILVSFWDGLFSGAFAVSFREGTSPFLTIGSALQRTPRGFQEEATALERLQETRVAQGLAPELKVPETSE